MPEFETLFANSVWYVLDDAIYFLITKNNKNVINLKLCKMANSEVVY